MNKNILALIAVLFPLSLFSPLNILFEQATNIVLSPSEKHFAVIYRDGTVTVFDADVFSMNNKVAATISMTLNTWKFGCVCSANFSADDRFLTVVFDDGKTRVFKLDTGECEKHLGLDASC